MKNRLRVALAALALATALPGTAQEFWMLAQPFSPAVGTPVTFTLHVGEYLGGKLLPFAASRAAAIQLYSKNAARDLLPQLPASGTLPALTLAFADPGTYMLAYDSQPNLVTLSADRFHAYLHDEGLDAIIRQREEAGTDTEPGRERYRRNVKTLVSVGGKSDGTYAALTGQRLEIVPAVDPLAKTVGDTLPFTLFFDSKPLGGALVKAWHKHDGQTVIIRAHTTPEGKVAFTLPYAGAWMISVVHMIPVDDVPNVDWDSFWGNLSFELAADS